VIEVGVQLGVLGFAGWVTMWLVLLADATLSRIMLVPIVVYATINGAIESTAPLVVGMFLAAAAPTVAISDLLPHRKRNDAERDVLGSHPALADP
jgi:hypothetical protein